MLQMDLFHDASELCSSELCHLEAVNHRFLVCYWGDRANWLSYIIITLKVHNTLCSIQPAYLHSLLNYRTDVLYSLQTPVVCSSCSHYLCLPWLYWYSLELTSVWHSSLFLYP